MSDNNQYFESYVPVYDEIPEKWEEARQFLVEQLKRVSNAINVRTIGWLLDEELLSGQSFIPSSSLSGSSQQFRSVFRKVVDLGSLIIGVNTIAHGVTFDSNFTLIDMWVSATNSSTLSAITMSDPQNVVMNSTNIVVTSAAAYNRAFAFVEYIQEL